MHIHACVYVGAYVSVCACVNVCVPDTRMCIEKQRELRTPELVSSSLADLVLRATNGKDLGSMLMEQPISSRAAISTSYLLHGYGGFCGCRCVWKVQRPYDTFLERAIDGAVLPLEPQVQEGSDDVRPLTCHQTFMAFPLSFPFFFLTLFYSLLACESINRTTSLSCAFIRRSHILSTCIHASSPSPSPSLPFSLLFCLVCVCVRPFCSSSHSS